MATQILGYFQRQKMVSVSFVLRKLLKIKITHIILYKILLIKESYNLIGCKPLNQKPDLICTFRNIALFTERKCEILKYLNELIFKVLLKFPLKYHENETKKVTCCWKGYLSTNFPPGVVKEEFETSANEVCTVFYFCNLLALTHVW